MANIKYLVDLDLNKNQLLNAVVQNLASAPGSPADGQIYWDTVLDSLFVWDATGSVWIDLGATGITNLDYTPSATDGTVTSDTGTDATVPLVTPTGGTNLAGLMSPADKTKLDGVTAGANVNVDTNITVTQVADVVTVLSSDGTDDTIAVGTQTNAGVLSIADKTKLDGIETGADVTDATNVNAAGAVMESDISSTPSGRIIDDDTMGTASNTTLATSESIKAYVDSIVAGGMIYKGGYNAGTNTPLLDSTPIATAIGDTYTVTASGTFFAEAVQVGDVLICEAVNATTAAEWTIVNKNIPDIVDSSETEKGIIEIATQAEVTTGTDDTRAITPLKLTTHLGETATLSSALVYERLISETTVTVVVTHGIGRRFVQVQVFEAAANDLVVCEIELTSTTTCTLKFNVAPTTNQYRVVIIG